MERAFSQGFPLHINPRIPSHRAFLALYVHHVLDIYIYWGTRLIRDFPPFPSPARRASGTSTVHKCTVGEDEKTRDLSSAGSRNHPGRPGARRSTDSPVSHGAILLRTGRAPARRRTPWPHGGRGGACATSLRVCKSYKSSLQVRVSRVSSLRGLPAQTSTFERSPRRSSLQVGKCACLP